MLLIDGGELAVFIIAGIAVLCGVVSGVFGIITKDTDYYWGLVIGLVIAGCLALAGLGMAGAHYQTRAAWTDLQNQGFTPLSVDLSSDEAVIKTSDGCILTRTVIHTEKDGYQLTLDDKVIRASELTCAR